MSRARVSSGRCFQGKSSHQVPIKLLKLLNIAMGLKLLHMSKADTPTGKEATAQQKSSVKKRRLEEKIEN